MLDIVDNFDLMYYIYGNIYVEMEVKMRSDFSNSKKPSIEQILYRLVAVQSDTGTKQEVDMAECIFSIIQEDRYFAENPHQCGCFHNGDILGRPVVWALKRAEQKTDKTIILNGHYDAAEIDSYGSLKPLALKPNELKPALKELNLSQEIREDLDNPDWCFGRATADMKAGIAINLHVLFADTKRDVNILFISVCDEENIAAGMLDAVTLLLKLKSEQELDYKLLFLTEPHVREDKHTFLVYNGSVGKLLPCVVAKGKLSHVGLISAGLNPVLMMSEIVKGIERNPDLCSSDLGVTTQPPTVLHMKDSKHSYDVSIPEYVSMYFNLLFFRNTPVTTLLDNIKNLCEEALQKVAPDHAPKVYSFGELEDICEKTYSDYKEIKRALYLKAEKQVLDGTLCLQDAGLLIVKETIRASRITEPLAVVGLLPPYLPATNNRYLPDYDYSKTMSAITEVLDKIGIAHKDLAYFMGLSDNSFTMCTDPNAEKRVLSNMVIPAHLYRVDYDSVAQLNVPSIIAGPWGKDYHTISERVYMPDVTETVPEILENIIKHL